MDCWVYFELLSDKKNLENLFNYCGLQIGINGTLRKQQDRIQINLTFF